MTPTTERQAALDEIALITRLRLVGKVDGPGKPKTEGRLSTHVLDNVAGKPAQGVAISLYEIGESARSLLAEGITNADGRTDAPLIGRRPAANRHLRIAVSRGETISSRTPPPSPIPPFSMWCRSAFPSPNRKAITTCRFW